MARTVRLPSPPDLLDAAGSDGLLWSDENGGLVGHGVAARLRLPGGLADGSAVRAVRDALASIDVDDEVGLPGCGAVAMGALPFDSFAAGELVVPRRVVGRAGDTGWVTTIEPAHAGAGVWAAAARDARSPHAGSPPAASTNGGHRRPAAPEPPDHFTLTSSMPHVEWKAVVAGAVDVLRAGSLRKVVLARRVDISANRPFVLPDVLSRLAALYPSCMIFSINGFVGASPELLIRRTGSHVETHPLAGTVARSGDAHADQALVAGLMESPKARHEHQVVVDFLRDALAPVCSKLEIPARPSVLGLRNVSHLATHITGRLIDREPPTALELVAAVHPTPAVGGTPTAAAVRYLRDVEGFDRGRYAGPVGWVDARGDGAWAIGIRSAEITGARARIYAGNGVVAGSDPAEELAETQLKLQALLAALVRP